MRNLMLGGLLLVPMALSVVAVPSAVEAQQKCGNVNTSIITCTEGDGTDGDEKNTGLWAILIMIINILIAGVGVLALAGVIYGAILYTSAGGNTEQVKKAMGVFTNVVIGVIAFAGMWALLNFLIPGGVFNSL